MTNVCIFMIPCWRHLIGTPLKKYISNRLFNTKNMESDPLDRFLLQGAKDTVPQLSQERYKGQAGRIGIIGGSLEYTGAAYYAAITTLKVGGDLAHVFCCKDAASAIKSYSPELIVHPVLDVPNSLELMIQWLPRLHVLVIGPGLGRNKFVLDSVANLIKYCREHHTTCAKPLVIDADGLFLITERPEIIQDYPHGAILTPNAIEFSRLAKAVLGETWLPTPHPKEEKVRNLATKLGSDITVLHKGATDIIAKGDSAAVLKCSTSGSNRRCGGQGDLLSGSLGIFYAWALMSPGSYPASVIAAYASCRLTRECNSRAFGRKGRSMLTTDMIEEIHTVFEELFETH
uniref:ATP-dependent (S)-NAD(P)H-hydrate dehydratase n=1 Tax=Timema shepardi TaxID=629360 RepID=A0A7R9B4K8_TIMSH|nr:unnamed protein product [Timema shepardi]